MAKKASHEGCKVCTHVRSLIDLRKQAEKKRKDLFDKRDAAEEQLHQCPDSDRSKRTELKAEYGDHVLEIIRYGRVIKAISHDVDDTLERSHQPELFDRGSPSMRAYLELADEQDGDDGDAAPGPLPIGRSTGHAPPRPAPVPQGEDQHLAASVTELQEHGLSGPGCRALVKAGFNSIAQLAKWFDADCPDGVADGLSADHVKAAGASLKKYRAAHRNAARRAEAGGA